MCILQIALFQICLHLANRWTPVRLNKPVLKLTYLRCLCEVAIEMNTSMFIIKTRGNIQQRSQVKYLISIQNSWNDCPFLTFLQMYSFNVTLITLSNIFHLLMLTCGFSLHYTIWNYTSTQCPLMWLCHVNWVSCCLQSKTW